MAGVYYFLGSSIEYMIKIYHLLLRFARMLSSKKEQNFEHLNFYT